MRLLRFHFYIFFTFFQKVLDIYPPKNAALRASWIRHIVSAPPEQTFWFGGVFHWNLLTLAGIPPIRIVSWLNFVNIIQMLLPFLLPLGRSLINFGILIYHKLMNLWRIGILSLALNQDSLRKTLENFQYFFLQNSASMGLISLNSLDLAGDGTPVYTSAQERKTRTCNCLENGIRDCKCNRIYHQPDCDIGWDSHRNRYYFGYDLYMLTASGFSAWCDALLWLL